MGSTRQLGLTSAVAIVVASMIGTGIFTTSGFLLEDLGSPFRVLLVWLLGGVLAGLGALSYGALARELPESGGEYLYLSRYLHPAAGYIAGWVSLLVGFSAPLAFSAFAVGEYARPWLPEFLGPKAAGSILLILFSCVHCLRTSRGARIQNGIVVFKLILLALFIGFAAARLSPPERLPAPEFSWSAVAVALVWVSFSYSGWNAAVYVAGEIRDPSPNLPRALLIGTATVTALYLLLNTIFVFSASPALLAGKVDVARVAARAIGGPGLGDAVAALIVVALATSISSLMMAGPRVYARMADDGYLPECLKNDGGSPRPAVIFQLAVALGLLWTATFTGLLTYIGFTLSLSTAATVGGLIVVRIRQGKRISIPGWPWVPAVFLVATVAIAGFTVFAQVRESLVGFVTIALGWVIWNRRQRALERGASLRARTAELRTKPPIIPPPIPPHRSPAVDANTRVELRQAWRLYRFSRRVPDQSVVSRLQLASRDDSGPDTSAELSAPAIASGELPELPPISPPPHSDPGPTPESRIDPARDAKDGNDDDRGHDSREGGPRSAQSPTQPLPVPTAGTEPEVDAEVPGDAPVKPASTADAPAETPRKETSSREAPRDASAAATPDGADPDRPCDDRGDFGDPDSSGIETRNAAETPGPNPARALTAPTEWSRPRPGLSSDTESTEPAETAETAETAGMVETVETIEVVEVSMYSAPIGPGFPEPRVLAFHGPWLPRPPLIEPRVPALPNANGQLSMWALIDHALPPQSMSHYRVQFDVFEGPLDLLLYLVKKEEVSIYEVNLTRIATQFIEYIDLMRELDLEVAGEFLVMAATLIYIKSRELLPVDQQADPGPDDEDEVDPRWELIRQLVEYKKFKDAASRLQDKEALQENVFPRRPPKPSFAPSPQAPQPTVSLFDLIDAVGSVLKRFRDRDTDRDIFEDKWTVSEKIELLRARIQESPRLRFADLFAGAANRTEVVVTFLAMLELIRLKVLIAFQREPFAEIEIGSADRPFSVNEGEGEAEDEDGDDADAAGARNDDAAPDETSEADANPGNASPSKGDQSADTERPAGGTAKGE